MIPYMALQVGVSEPSHSILYDANRRVFSYFSYDEYFSCGRLL